MGVNGEIVDYGEGRNGALIVKIEVVDVVRRRSVGLAALLRTDKVWDAIEASCVLRRVRSKDGGRVVGPVSGSGGVDGGVVDGRGGNKLIMSWNIEKVVVEGIW